MSRLWQTLKFITLFAAMLAIAVYVSWWFPVSVGNSHKTRGSELVFAAMLAAEFAMLMAWWIAPSRLPIEPVANNKPLAQRLPRIRAFFIRARSKLPSLGTTAFFATVLLIPALLLGSGGGPLGVLWVLLVLSAGVAIVSFNVWIIVCLGRCYAGGTSSLRASTPSPS